MWIHCHTRLSRSVEGGGDGVIHDRVGCVMRDLRFVWLEITGRCQLRRAHCYAESGPDGGEGVMGPADWRRVIDEVVELGGRMVQFIGGEPTLYRWLPDLVRYALDHGLEVEVFSNLVHVPERLWQVFTRPGVRLATKLLLGRRGRARGGHRRPGQPRTD